MSHFADVYSVYELESGSLRRSYYYSEGRAKEVLDNTVSQLRPLTQETGLFGNVYKQFLDLVLAHGVEFENTIVFDEEDEEAMKEVWNA